MIGDIEQGARGIMVRQAILTGLVELGALGLLSSAVALWAVALAPIH